MNLPTQCPYCNAILVPMNVNQAECINCDHMYQITNLGKGYWGDESQYKGYMIHRSHSIIGDSTDVFSPMITPEEFTRRMMNEAIGGDYIAADRIIPIGEIISHIEQSFS